MRPEDRALLTVVVAVVVVVGFIGGYLLLSSAAPPESLPVPAGTVFSANVTEHWAAPFTVGGSGGRLLGGWTAYDGAGYVGLIVVNGTVAKPWPPLMLCPHIVSRWVQFNGTVDRSLAPGPYTVYWSTGFCSSAARIVVTETIQVVTL